MLFTLIKKYKEVLLYLFFGVLTTIINIVVFEFCISKLHLPISSANGIAWFFSVLVAFITNKAFVFQSNEKRILREISLFYLARIASLILETLALILMIDVLHMSSIVAKMISNVFVIIFNYIFSKFIIFK